MSDPIISFQQRLDFRLKPVREGYLSGQVTLLGKVFDVEAFRMVAGQNVPDNARHRRTVDVLNGLQINDVWLHQVELPGVGGKWLLVMYPGENEYQREEVDSNGSAS
jgi:hypothetical protein